MGLAELPRAYFRGFVYWNPSTMNNNDYQPTYDPASATLNWPWLERHGLQDPARFDAYVTQPGIVPSANDALNSNVDSSVPPAEWNFYGDNACGFVQADEPVIEWPEKFSKPAGGTTITGFTDASGTLVTSGDPWIGQPIQLNAGIDPAKLVDVDPICVWSSQLFHDTVGVGPPQGGVGLAAKPAGRAHSRWVILTRNLNTSGDVIIAGVGSAMFQTGLPAADISFLDREPPPGSLAAQLQHALAEPDVQGLMVRFVSYHTVYFHGSAFAVRGQPDWKAITALYALYAAERDRYDRGELEHPPPPPVNRAYSNVVGWLAPWTRDDMRSMAVGRILHSAGAVQPLDAKLTPRPLGPAVLEHVPDATDPTLVERVSVDLGSTVPELDSALTKVDFGTLQLELVGTPFAQIPYRGGYDKDAYEATAGVIDIRASEFLNPLSVADLGAGQITVTVGKAGEDAKVALREAEYTAETDDRATYLNEPGMPWSQGEGTIAVQVRARGGKPPAGAKLRIAQYAPLQPGFGENAWQLVSAGSNAQTQTPYVEMRAGGQSVVDGAWLTVEVPCEPDGRPYATVALTVAALRSGPPIVRFNPLPPGTPSGEPKSSIGLLATAQEFFANVRVLPYHNAVAVAFENWLRTGPAVDLATQRIFDLYFRTFFTMYPRMRFIRDPLQFQAWRGPILEVTDPAGFETSAYMPVMRSTSAGQRRMLELWATYLDGHLPTPPSIGPLGRRG